MRNLVTPLEKKQTFCFSCSPQVACFNRCCRDLNQVLTPYDVLCLKQFLEISSAEFLDRYTEKSTGPATGLPVVSLRFKDADDLACPFVTDVGCRVYPARPASCRSYPLARGVSRNRETGILTEQWALIRESHCLGFRHGKQQTVDQWVDGQQLADHNRMNDMMLELISHKNRYRSDPLLPAENQRVYTALYNLDRFRDGIFEKDGPLAITIDSRALDRARSSELELLQVGIKWVIDNVFNVSMGAPENENRCQSGPGAWRHQGHWKGHRS